MSDKASKRVNRTPFYDIITLNIVMGKFNTNFLFSFKECTEKLCNISSSIKLHKYWAIYKH